MLKLSRFFENIFSVRGISSEELRSFAEDHLGKLEAHSAYATMLTATQAVFDPFDAALSARAEQIGSLGGDTLTKDQVLQLFRTKIRQRRGRVVDVFAEGSAEYREIFPQGLTYYTKATMETIKQRLDYAVEKFTKFQAQLGAPLLAEFTALRSSFNEARTGQVEVKGQVSQARGAVKTTRTALELQLMKNLLTLAKDFVGQPEKEAEFFDQSKLEDPTQSQEAEDVVPPSAS
ncbi:MAG TPA: hypothetical protein VF585_05400 [Chthoniobacterales bacterium]|jgi:hypothetical protein